MVKDIIQAILIPIIMYLLGCFITFSFNPLNWWILSHWMGRLSFLILTTLYGIWLFWYFSLSIDWINSRNKIGERYDL